jgi:CheY-like chemotaxis protein
MREVDLLLNVLWLEDEPDSVRCEVMVARAHGWNVTCAETVAQALELVRDETFDLVVADLIVPPADYEKKRGFVDAYAGIHFIELVRDQTRSGRTPPDVPILIMTAVVTEELKGRVLGKLESSRFYLNKPIEEETYLEVVKQLTQKIQPPAQIPPRPYHRLPHQR